MNTVASTPSLPHVSVSDAEQYWSAAISASHEAVPLPLDHPPVDPSPGPADGRIRFDVSATAWERLDKLTGRSPFLLLVTLVTVANIVHHKFARGAVVLIGCEPRQSRRGDRVGGLLPIVQRIDTSLSFQQFLLQVRDTMTRAHKYEDAAVDAAARRLQIAVLLHDGPGDRGRLAPMTLSFDASGGMLRSAIDVDERVFSRGTAERIAREYRAILERALTDRTSTVAQLCEASDEELTWLRSHGNGGQLSLTDTILDLFEQQAIDTPDAVALVFGDRQLTYDELNRRANQLARALQTRGARPEARVALLFERSIDLIIAMLATLKAGAAYVPLDPSHPVERLRRVCEDARAAMVVTTSGQPHDWAPTHADVLCVDRQALAIAAEQMTNLPRTVTARNLAYIIHTSGSTGTPKGIAVTHEGVRNLVAAQLPIFGIGQGTCLLQFASATFDASVSEWTTTLAAGGRLVLADQASMMPGADLTQLLRAQEIEVVTLPPSVLTVLSEEGLPALRTVVTAGEPCSPDLVRRWHRGRRFLNAYGPTETTVCATISEPLSPAGTVDIGRPIPNGRVYVLDGRGSPVPIGAIGELHVGGAGVARAYVGRPDLTAVAFLPDPFADEPGARMYRTGDRARWLEHGALQFLGRQDRQVKVRGYRIEPAEIESALLAFDGIEQCAVVLREDANHEPALVAFIVSRQRQAPGVAELRRHLEARLPVYMIPEAFVPLADVPRTSAGKIDRERLPAAERVSPPRALIVKPRDSLEMHLKQLWEDALGVGEVGITDDFFELGGHSMKAVSLSARLSKVYGAKIPVRTLFDRPTVERMAAFLRQGVALSPPTSVVPLQTRGGRRPFFCVHPGGGLVQAFVDIVQRLGTDQPFYAFQSRGLDADEALHTTVEAMAAAYIADMRTIQPHGPYQIGGLSMGALVAFEMACQLEAAGDAVSLVALLDGAASHEPSAEADDVEQLARWEREYVRFQATQDTDLTAGEMAALDPDEQVSRYLQAAQARGQIPADVTVPQFRRFLRVYANNVAAQVRYRPRPYAGCVTLFRAADQDAADAAHGWRDYALGGVDVHEFPGPHGRFIYEPHVGEFVATLRRCMDSVTMA